DRLELALQVMRTERRHAREAGQRHRLIGVAREKGGRLPHSIECRAGDTERIRTATLAGAKALESRLSSGIEEANAIGTRPPAGTTRPAIHARRCHAVHKGAIGPRVATRQR